MYVCDSFSCYLSLPPPYLPLPFVPLTAPAQAWATPSRSKLVVNIIVRVCGAVDLADDASLADLAAALALAKKVGSAGDDLSSGGDDLSSGGRGRTLALAKHVGSGGDDLSSGGDHTLRSIRIAAATNFALAALQNAHGPDHMTHGWR